MKDRERLPSASTSAVGVLSLAGRLLIRSMAGLVLAIGLLLGGASAALADGLVIGVSVSDRPSTPPGPGTSLQPSGTGGQTTSVATDPGGSPIGTETSVGVDPDGAGQQPPAGGGSDDDLASTGLSTFWLVAPGVLLVLAGALAVTTARRRRPGGAHAR